MATSPIYSWPEPDNTDLVKNGALAIRTLGNAIDTTMGTMVAKTIIDAKGDLIAGTAADTAARLAVGNNGETLVADSSASTGLRYQSNFAAGKNKVLNGDFNINQRNFTSVTSGYGFDRWKVLKGGDGTCTYTPQTFTPGTAPVAGYEGKTYPRLVTTGTSSANEISSLSQYIESVRTLANQAIVISFWAKTTSGTPKVAVAVGQDFGTGGSPSAIVDTFFSQVTLSTSWTRYTVTGTVPSISGKTIGTNRDDALRVYLTVSAGSDFNALTGSLGTQNGTFEFWGVQVEAGSTATAFQTATGTFQGELAACQRYYWRSSGQADAILGTGVVNSGTTGCRFVVNNPVSMRTSPTSVDYSTLEILDADTAFAISSLTLTSSENSQLVSAVNAVSSGLTLRRFIFLRADGSTSAYIGFSAEL